VNRSSRLKSAAERLGGLGVIGSLLFVGIEIRQNAEATRAAATRDLRVPGSLGMAQERHLYNVDLTALTDRLAKSGPHDPPQPGTR